MTDEAKSGLKSLGYMPEAEFAALRQVDIRTLRNERSRRDGPPFVKVGRQIGYPLEAVREFYAKRVVDTRAAPTLADGRGRRRRKASR